MMEWNKARYIEGEEDDSLLPGMKLFHHNFLLRLGTRSYQNEIIKRSFASLNSSIFPGKHFNSVKLNNVRATSTDSTTGNCEKPGQKLLKFKVPPLQETIEKWKKTIHMHLNQEECEETMKELDKFLKGPGPKLQKLLEKEAENSDNWLAERWLKFAYLGYRDPVVIYSSPGMIYPPQKFASDEEFLRFAAKVMYCGLKYKEIIDKGELPVEKIVGRTQTFELDMSQYRKVFGTCRIPCAQEDKIEYNPKSKHVAVAYKNNWFVVECYDKCGNILHPDIFYKKLKHIHEMPFAKDCLPIGILTATNRDFWAKAYKEFLNESKDTSTIKKIQTSLFTLSLDDPVEYKDEDDLKVSCEQLIHGGSTKSNSGNRWFDKTIQFIVNPSGLSGMCYEHSPAEGQPVANLSDFIAKLSNDPKILSSASKDDPQPNPEKLNICIGPKTAQRIQEAKVFVDNFVSKFDLYVLEYKKYGKNFMKTMKVSPDSYCQIAMQLAFYNLHKKPGAQYESAHLRMFKDGRTETIRSCTPKVYEFVKAMSEKCGTDAERMELFQKAMESHKTYVTQALQGKGVDRHLLGLKLMATEKGIEIPAFFSTPGIKKSAYFQVSTSQVKSQFRSLMAYGPAVEDGYACCYNPRETSLIFGASCFKICPGMEARKFGCAIASALDAMHDLVKSQTKPKSKL